MAHAMRSAWMPIGTGWRQDFSFHQPFLLLIILNWRSEQRGVNQPARDRLSATSGREIGWSQKEPFCHCPSSVRAWHG